MTDASPPLAPDLAEQLAAVDPIAVANAIVAQGKRGAIKASTVEIIAMATLLTALVRAADIAFDVLATADRLLDEKDPAVRRAIADQTRSKISDLAAELLKLGYGIADPSTTEAKETTNGEG